MDEKKKVPRWLCWPWNVVIYVALAAVLRLWSIPFILGMLAMQRKANPHGAAEGYCLSRTRTRLKMLPWGLVLLALGAVMGVCLAYPELRPGDGEWYVLPVCIVMTVGLVAAGGYMAFAAVRDSMFPAKSKLAASIRSQLPYPDEAPGVDELFAMVDNDLKENATWLGSVGIGKEWVLGDEASLISRICGIFTVDRIEVHHRGGRTQSSRVLELVLIDDRWRMAITDFKDPQDLKAAGDCLALRVPDAVRGVNDQYLDFMAKKEEEREQFLQERRSRRNREATRQLQNEAGGQSGQDMILTCADGTVTSRVTPGLLEEQLTRCLAGEAEVFFLTPGRPVSGEGQTFVELECSTGRWTAPNGAPGVRLLLKAAPPQAGQPSEQGLQQVTDQRQAVTVLRCWLRGEVPNLRGWEPVQMWVPKAPRQSGPQRQIPPPRLELISGSGVRQCHENFTMEDVQVGADGLVDGSYRSVDLILPGGYLWFRAEIGDSADGRCTVKATRADPDKLRFFTAKCTHRQAAAWLMEYAAGRLRPDGPDWKDCTRQMEKKG